MRQAIINLAEKRRNGQHPGLLLQRFVAEPTSGEKGNPEEKRAILSAAIAAADNADLRAYYRAACKRWVEALPKLTAAADLTTAGRLIVGLGTENVLETGIRLHHTYGLPIIPGSALKGLAAHYCHEVWGQRHLDSPSAASKPFQRPTKAEDEAYRKFLGDSRAPQPPANHYRLLFGNTDDSGCITFHDAWLTPDAPHPLVPDVMTPHHPNWVDGTKPPTDFDSPVPIPFVSVAGTFHVAVSWTGPTNDRAQRWTELAFGLLRDALREWGVGGKTSSGYGRLVDPKELAQSAGVASGVQSQSTPAKKRASSTPTRVKIIGPRPKGGFDVQEPGRAQGTLTVGTAPPGVSTAPDTEVDVQVHDDVLTRPQYKWPPPPKK